MKKILFIIYGLKNKGGSERVATELANMLVESHEIDIICKKSDEIAYEIDRRVNIIYVDKSGLALILDYKKQAEKKQYDYVVIHSMTRLTVSLILVGLRHPNLISLEHISSESNGFILKLLKRVLYSRLKDIAVLTNKDKKFYDKFHNSVRVIRNPSPFKEHKLYKKTNNKIIAIGSLIKRKGFDRLIEAWREIEPYSKDFVLEIYGKGEEKENLKKLISQYDLKKVHLMGQTEEVYEIYKSASMFIMTSHFEGLPMVLIEAQSLGLPIISYDCPYGHSEIIIDNINGYLVENSNQIDLVKKVIFLINNPSERDSLSNNALLSSKRFSVEKISKDWKKLLN